MVAANVGGIPEIFGPHADGLFTPGAVGAIADTIERALVNPEAVQAQAKALRERIFVHFSQQAMVQGVLAGYEDAFAALRRKSQ
jgi:glycosyltransferase involved in cell wall biosynthesis